MANENFVSIPSRVLISSNTVPASPLFLYAHTSLCGADSFFTVSSHPYICQNTFQPGIHAMRGRFHHICFNHVFNVH